MKSQILVLLFLSFSLASFSQLKGVVLGMNDSKREPLIGAKLKLLNRHYRVTKTARSGLAF